jgi:hypothetical protein
MKLKLCFHIGLLLVVKEYSQHVPRVDRQSGEECRTIIDSFASLQRSASLDWELHGVNVISKPTSHDVSRTDRPDADWGASADDVTRTQRHHVTHRSNQLRDTESVVHQRMRFVRCQWVVY